MSVNRNTRLNYINCPYENEDLIHTLLNTNNNKVIQLLLKYDSQITQKYYDKKIPNYNESIDLTEQDFCKIFKIVESKRNIFNSSSSPFMFAAYDNAYQKLIDYKNANNFKIINYQSENRIILKEQLGQLNKHIEDLKDNIEKDKYNEINDLITTITETTKKFFKE